MVSEIISTRIKQYYIKGKMKKDLNKIKINKTYKYLYCKKEKYVFQKNKSQFII